MKSLFPTVSNFLKSHLLGISLLSIVLSLIGAFLYDSVKQSPPVRSEIFLITTQIQPDASQIGPDLSAPIVRFADGKRAYINFSVVTRVQDEDAPRVVSYAGNEESARELLRPPTIAAVYSVFEKLSFEDAGTRRQELEITLLNLLQPKYDEAGITLDSISLEAFILAEDR